MNKNWLNDFSKDLKKLNFVIEQEPCVFGILVAMDNIFRMRVAKETIRGSVRYKADVGVGENFDRWANSRDWFVDGVTPFSAKSLIDVVSLHYRNKNYNPFFSESVDITSDVGGVEKCQPNKTKDIA